MKKVLFIHRSVGHHLLRDGKVRDLLNAKDISLDDYDNNNGLTTYDDGETTTGVIQMPGNNTNPENLAEFFAAWPSVLNGYDAVVVKSCYPNSHIQDGVQLEKIKERYRVILKTFNSRTKHLILLTTPPLRPLFTNANEAKLAGELADWLVTLASPNTHILDLHRIYAEPAGKHEGMLKRSYRRLLPFDNHPNKKAHQAFAPSLVAFISKAVKDLRVE